MTEHERFKIEVIGEDGEPLFPKESRQRFVAQAGVVVRDNIDIRIREWHKQKDETVTFVDQRTKEMLWDKLMVNFTLPEDPEADPEDDQEENAIEKKVQEWTFKNMAEQFKNWKKRLVVLFVKKHKTPVFKGAYEKIKDQWPDFVKYKKSEEAKKKSEKIR